MSTIKKIAKNTGSIIAGDILFRLISLFVIVYLAKYLGPADFGKFNFVFAYVAFYSVFTDLGMQTVLVRDISRNKSIPKIFPNALSIRLILSVFAAGLTIISISLLNYPVETKIYVYIVSSTIIFNSFSDLYMTIFQASLKMEYNIYAKLSSKFLSSILILWIIFSHGTLMNIMSILVFTELIKMLTNYYFSKKFIDSSFAFDFQIWKYLIKEALPFALMGIVTVIYYRIDILMLSFMKGDVSVGLYSAAYKISEPLSLIPLSLMVSMFPVMSASYLKSDNVLMKSLKHSMRFILISTLPIAVGTTILAEKIISLVYGSDFSMSALSLQILIWSLLFTGINSVLVNTLIAINQQKLTTITISISTFTNVVLNFILISKLDFVGASIATVISASLLSVLNFYFIRKYLSAVSMHKLLIKPLISSIAMGLLIANLETNIIILILLGAIFYFISLIVLKEFNIEDVNMIKKLF